MTEVYFLRDDGLFHAIGERGAQVKLDLDKEWWGWRPVFAGSIEELRRPLPPTERHPPMLRTAGGSIDAFEMPPYLTAAQWRNDRMDVVSVDLWDGIGYRVGHTHDGRGVGDGGNDFIYADSPNVPSEWRPVIAAALKEVAEKWPGVAVRFRPNHDAVPLTPALIDSFLSPPTGESDASQK